MERLWVCSLQARFHPAQREGGSLGPRAVTPLHGPRGPGSAMSLLGESTPWLAGQVPGCDPSSYQTSGCSEIVG